MAKIGVNDGGVLYGINQAIHYIDIKIIVILGAFGCLLTGFTYSLFSRWGFFRHGWMILKWIITIAAILFGMFYLGPWEVAMMNLSGQLGLAALTDAAYLQYEFLHAFFGTVQALVLVGLLFISIFKPWKNIRKQKKA
ncbi:hypothetical protein GO013_16485 [Pseudodesulfovibrio sp. JC047]|uniref:hypothetical protein n=1 Tax=Pseudodesulfovibrio sp. JC047 TaxID=2683199 RepID=UPI0013D01019|nr:hypothetical protein [Pseudodesulfovibrio sp. JC047]NDV21010.1 hypothetical protein [Pseudodesulfovibrio sp. JC047]